MDANLEGYCLCQ